MLLPMLLQLVPSSVPTSLYVHNTSFGITHSTWRTLLTSCLCCLQHGVSVRRPPYYVDPAAQDNKNNSNQA